MILAHLDYVKAACQRVEMIMISFVSPSLVQAFKIFTTFFLWLLSWFFPSSEPPKFTNRPPTFVGGFPGTNVTLCCEASGSPRPNVEWYQGQKSSVSFPLFQKDGCLLIKMGEENVDFICRAKNSFGLVETTTLVIAEILGGIIYELLLPQSLKNM